MQSGRYVSTPTPVLAVYCFPNRSRPERFKGPSQQVICFFSLSTLRALDGVLRRPKFDRYLEPVDRDKFLRLLARLAIMVDVTHRVQTCRDPKDDKFMEVALNEALSVVARRSPASSTAACWTW